jgi:hypothetical protein
MEPRVPHICPILADVGFHRRASLIFLMARLARMVVAGLPRRVTQGGNRREALFFEDGDQEIYRAGQYRGRAIPHHSEPQNRI